jgi:hypothetical protein
VGVGVSLGHRIAIGLAGAALVVFGVYLVADLLLPLGWAITFGVPLILGGTYVMLAVLG